MTIDEAIKNMEESAETFKRLQEKRPDIQGFKETRLEYEKLAEWLKELKSFKEKELIYNSTESKLKNPKAKTFDILRFVADNAGLSNFEAIEKAYHMGVSEQEQVLDKIRAEIEHFIYNINPSSSESDYACNYILNIIDKYKEK